MKPITPTTATIIISGFAIGLIFVFGQVIYYNKKLASTGKEPRIVLRGQLTANLNIAMESSLVLKTETKHMAVEPTEVKKWIESYTRDYTGKQELRVNPIKVSLFLQKASETVNVPATNARLTMIDGKIGEFQPPKNGQKLNISATTTNIIASMGQINRISQQTNIIDLSVDEIEPAITLDKINKLGVNELLARGESDFGGSPKNRTHNIIVGAKQFNGIILAPSEEFSFNKLLGAVDASTGYLPELVIKGGKLIPEYGGGLCQVSTTIFRAANVAGLPILERHPHALPVRYYNPQGYDATIYPGVSDFRFKNDTLAHILIQSKIVGSKLYFEIYGTKDGRQVTIDGPRSYDIQKSGALKAELFRTVTYPDGQIKKDIFKSSYKAPGLFPTVRNPLE
ncbi:MAG: VanW family protein [bacterium]|nr:VanW family protein [bacterium]